MEEDIIKVSNDYYYYRDKYDKRLINIIDRFDHKTNKLYIDLRNRESDYKRLNKKVEYLYNYFTTNYNDAVINYSIKNIDIDIVNDEYTYIYIRVILNVYTLFVVVMLINLSLLVA